MDAYVTTLDSFTPSAYVQTLDELWEPKFETETVWYVEHAPVRAAVVSSTSTQASLTDFWLADVPVLAGLERLRSFQGYEDNWDGEGGASPEAAAVETAVQLFSLLSNHAVPQVSLNSLGQLMLVYNSPQSGEIVITGPQRFSYFFSGEEELFADDEPFSGNLPDDLLTRLSVIA